MITELFLTVVKYLVFGVLTAIPVLQLPGGILGAVAGVVEILASASIFFPVGITLTCIGWFIVMYNMNFVMSIVNWVLRRIPTQS